MKLRTVGLAALIVLTACGSNGPTAPQVPPPTQPRHDGGGFLGGGS
jgi:predicted small lipoprotein YifL